MRAVIVGAGIAGLATALRLRRSGWRTLVVERAAGPRGGGYVINFSGLGYDAAERLGVLPALRAVETPPARMVYVDAAGREQAAMEVDVQRDFVGGKSLALLRGDLEAVLREALDEEVEIRFGVTVDEIGQGENGGVSVRLSDGSSESADLVVGADGLHSAVRALAFGPEEPLRVDLGCMVCTYLLDAKPAGVEPGTTTSLSLLGRGIGVYTARGARSAAFFTYRSGDPDEELRAGPQRALRRAYGDLGWVVPELLDHLDRDGSVYFDQVSQVRMDRWSRGRVVLVGDAAWCVTLFAGFGSSLAVAGAEHLGDALDRHPGDLTRALDEWEAGLRRVVARKQRQGRRARALFVTPNRATLWARTAMVRFSANPLVLRAMRAVLDYRAHEPS